jgi:hypothetical protein
MVFQVLDSTARFADGRTCWQKAYNNGHCPVMANPLIYKKSLEKINEVNCRKSYIMATI